VACDSSLVLNLTLTILLTPRRPLWSQPNDGTLGSLGERRPLRHPPNDHNFG